MNTKIQKAKRGEILEEIAKLNADTLIFISDEKVWALYGKYFKFPDKRMITWISAVGEESKSFQNFEKCMEFLFEKKIHRNCHVIALGGGVVSDFAGFVSSTALRGIVWSIIPTTILAMVDASIGGKTGLNSKWGKNLVGRFHFPEKVWIDYDYIQTLDENEVRNGHGEVLKYAFLSKEIFDKVISGDKNIYSACAKYKSDLVERDPFENGERKLLNLGHTFGHAFEKMLGMSHGLSVIYGIKYLNDNYLGKRFDNEFNLLLNALRIGVLPDSKIDKDQMMNFVKRDKKNISSGEIELILLDAVGIPVVKTYKLSSL